MANWQRSGKKSKRPKRISPLAASKDVKHGKVPEGRTPGEVMAMLARYGPAKPDGG